MSIPRYLLMLVVIGGFVVAAPAQEPAALTGPPAAAEDPLATRQQIARDRMTQLEDRMYRLAERLRDREPQQARRIEQALQKARELLIHRDMDEAVRQLQSGDLAGAVETQYAVLRNLEELYKALTREPDRRAEIEREMERLRQFREQIEALEQQQRELRDRTLGGATQPAPSTRRGADDQTGEAPDLSGEQRDLQARAVALARRMAGKQADPSDRSAEPLADADAPEQAPEKAAASPGGDADVPPMESERRTDGDSPGRSPRSAGRGTPNPRGQPSPASDSQAEEDPAPGSENVEQAAEHMDAAAGELDRRQMPRAGEQQQNAIDQLEQARRQLEEILDQLRREQQEEMLRGLESRFKAMLVRQTEINQTTGELDARGADQWTRNDELRLAGAAQEETALAGEADQALNLLREEGTTIVFPRIVEQMGEDMRTVAELLRSRLTGANTQAVQKQIVETLEELIEAVRQMRQELQSGQSGGPPPGGRQVNPLLPTSAELKLLRSSQIRINQQTAQAGQTLRQAGEDAALRSAVERQLRRVADRQKDVAEMARRLSERQTGQ